MGSSIEDILKNNGFSEPPDIAVIKEFVAKTTGQTPSVAIKDDSFIVTVKGASAAGTLRFQLTHLQKELKTNKRIMIRIS